MVLGLLVCNTAFAKFLVCEFSDGMGAPWILKKINGTWCKESVIQDEEDCDAKLSEDAIYIMYDWGDKGFQHMRVDRHTGKFTLNTKVGDIKDFAKGTCQLREKKKF